MTRSLPSHAEYVAEWSRLHGGYEPRPGSLVSGYLRAMHVLARPWARIGTPPDLVTLGALLLTALAPVLAWQSAPSRPALLAMSAVLALTGLLDGVDGAVAVLQGRQSRWGGVLDSIADRCSEMLALLTLWLLGAPGAWILAALVVTLMVEYLRARAGAQGMSGIGVVTVLERPTRIALAAMACLGVAVSGLTIVIVLTAYAWVALGVVALMQLAVVARRELR